MDCDIRKRDNNESDFITDLYNRGFHQILEKIVFKLPLKDVVACTEVNKEWSRMICSFQISKNPRLRKLQDMRIADEWRKKSPNLFFYEIFTLSCDDKMLCHDLIVHKENVVMLVLAPNKQLYFIYVYVYDSEMAFIEGIIFRPKGDWGLFLDEPYRTSMDDNHLYISVEEYCLIWTVHDTHFEFHSEKKTAKRFSLVTGCAIAILF